MTDHRKRRSRPKSKRQNHHIQGPTVEVLIDRFGHDGRGIGLWQDKTLFVSGAIAGERVKARIVRKQSRFAEAEAVQILTPAAERVQPVCTHFTECGGCQLQHMSSDLQLQIKQQSVQDQLARTAHIHIESLLPSISAACTGYRTRARLHVWFNRDGILTLGFRLKNNQKLVKIEHCQVLAPQLNALLDSLHLCLGLHKARAITHIEMLASASERALIVRHTAPLGSEILTALNALVVQYGCHIWLQNSADTRALVDLDGVAVTPLLQYNLPAWNLSMQFHPADFTQVNPAVNEQMIQQALAWLAPQPDEHIVDLFCGIGNFTLPLARHCAKVTGIEVIESMVQRGKENALRNQVFNATFIAADLSIASAKYLQASIGKIDALLLDPPRAGARDVCENIAKLSPQRILYVSCNPSTLARDSASLTKAGYKLVKLGIMDMFPHTSHVESMALFIQ